MLGGIIYLHDISLDRVTGTARNGLVVLNQLCGKDALKKVVLGITKSTRLHPDEAKKREERFKGVHWEGKIGKAAKVFRIDEGNSAQARELVNAVLERFQIWGAPVLRIQRELVDEKKSIDQTLAWETAWNSMVAWTASLWKMWRRS